MKTTKNHYVEFMSPGTLFRETTRKPIEGWDVRIACAMADEVTERHGARPYAFCFITMLEAPPVVSEDGTRLNVQPKELTRSALYYLGGTVLTYDAVKAREDKRDSILLSNMRCNRLPLVIENRNSFLTVNEFSADDCVVDPAAGKITRTGRDEDLSAYREMTLAEWEC